MAWPPFEQRFWNKVAIGDIAECWLWRGAKKEVGPDARGAIRCPVRRALVLAHRVSWELTHGPIPNGLCVCHRCDHPLCCNPTHLFLGTQAENVADMDSKNRRHVLRGESAGSAKLTWAQAQDIRNSSTLGKSLQQLATEFGVGKSSIRRIINRETWRLLDDVEVTSDGQ